MEFDLIKRLIYKTISNEHIKNNFDLLIDMIKNNKNREMIIHYILDNYADRYLLFCFELIYDLDEFKDKTLEYLENRRCKMFLQTNILINFMKNTSYGKSYVLNNLDSVINNCSSNLDTIIKYLYSCNDLDMINKIVNYPDLHIRYLVINYFIDNYQDKFSDIYPELIDNLKINNELMNINDISKLTVKFLDLNNKELYLKLKQYILSNYKDNDLGEELVRKFDNDGVDNNLDIFNEFISDIDNLFETSSRYKFRIYDRFSKRISKELLDNYKYYLNMFMIDGKVDPKMERITMYRLWNELVEYVDKYMDLSKDKTYNYVVSGFGTSTYRIGDYAFKLSRLKHSSEDIICPNNFLILKNLEEQYIRGKNNFFHAGIEVQNYLTRYITDDIPEYIITKRFPIELKNLGYFVNDKLIDGNYGDNCMLLDSYMDADCDNPENLPDWFKEYPVVLVDRDLVYKLGTVRRLDR